MVNKTTLIEIIFAGSYSDVNFNFIENLISDSDTVRLNFPEINDFESINLESIMKVLIESEYVDIAFDSYKLSSISNIFVNVTIDNGKVELLYFLGLKDVGCDTPKESLDILINWGRKFGIGHNFESLVFKPDNASSIKVM